MLKREGEKMNRVLKLKIEAVYRDLTAKDKRIADYIVKYPEQVMTLSIRELAQVLEVAESTIFRFVQRLGYEGYKQFKLELAQTQGKPQLTTNLYEEISANDSPVIIAQKVFEANTQALIDTQHLLADDAFEEAVRLLSEAKSIFFLEWVDLTLSQWMRIINFCVRHFLFHMRLIVIFNVWKPHV